MKKEFEVIAKIIQNNKRVLDIGCGDGTLMEIVNYIKEITIHIKMYNVIYIYIRVGAFDENK